MPSLVAPQLLMAQPVLLLLAVNLVTTLTAALHASTPGTPYITHTNHDAG